MRTATTRPTDTGMGEPPKFQIDCFPFIFSFEELEVLENKGFIMKALAEGKRRPENDEEQMFVRFINGNEKARTTMATAWSKYINRQKLEASLLETEEVYREYKKLRG